MFVLNDCRTDTRVLREAATLVVAGHEVTIMARPSGVSATTGEREDRDGFAIIRVPIPQGWRRRWLFLRAPWRFRDAARQWIATQLHDAPTGWVRLAVTGLAAIVLAPVLLAAAAAIFALRRVPGLGAAGGGLDWLIGWRFSILAWGRAAAAAAPVADVYHGHDLTGLPAARWARARTGGALVYDSHEYFLEAGPNARRPAWAKRILGRLQRHWASGAAALVTVNRTLADQLGAQLGIRRVVVVHNAPPTLGAGARRLGPPAACRRDPGRCPGRVVPWTLLRRPRAARTD